MVLHHVPFSLNGIASGLPCTPLVQPSFVMLFLRACSVDVRHRFLGAMPVRLPGVQKHGSAVVWECSCLGVQCRNERCRFDVFGHASNRSSGKFWDSRLQDHSEVGNLLLVGCFGVGDWRIVGKR